HKKQYKTKKKVRSSMSLPHLSSCMSKSKIDVEEAIKNQNNVALIVSKHLFSNEAKHSNIVFSPASINTALTLVASGPGGSSVADEILSFLKSSSTVELNAVFSEIVSVVFADSSAEGGPKISPAYGLWIEQSLPVESYYKDLFENFFKAGFNRVDFRKKAEQVRTELNAWAENHTNGLIKDVLPPGSVTSVTDWVYGNALYFKGVWQTPFDKFLMRDREFFLVNGTSVSVPFMSSYGDQYIEVYDGFKVLKTPYRQGRDEADDTNHKFSMYFFLPDKKDGLDSLVETMTSTCGFLDSHIPSYEVKVGEFGIPKFKIDYGLDCGKALSGLGLRKMSLYHKACVEIDEEGAIAAAVTFVIPPSGCPLYMEPPKRIDFVADHPFLFLIREDKTGTVLFAGQIFDPSKSSSPAYG
ncbi:unnamed protein product, partial [Arabidopsis halleri]